MKYSGRHHQGSLFTPTTTIVDDPKPSPTTTQPIPPNTHPDPFNVELTRDELAAQVIKGLIEYRRWEKELILGASDEELSAALGTCWATNTSLDIHCSVHPQPHLICSTTMGQELLRLEATEIATLI